MGKVEIVVQRNPLGIVRQDFHPHLTSNAVRAPYLSYDDIRRLRVVLLS
jgi:hypothetical protein